VQPIGILGGTFDPVHYGHLRPAREVQRALELEQVRFIPAAHPPHRATPVASAAQRLHMVELALADYPGFVVDDRELTRDGPSYSVPTLESLRAEYGNRPLCLLIGADAFDDLQTWHQWERLPELAHLIVMQRPGWSVPPARSELPEWARSRLCRDGESLARQGGGCLVFQHVTPQAISATDIRNAIARGEAVQDRLPPAVWEYIRAHGLYRE
jgi:nicotinate-nucleotide adenylyltransferase